MKVKLFCNSQPTSDFSDLGLSSASELIAYCARVSNPANQYNNETADNLIGFLVKWGHWSPLEMVSATLEIETTRDIARQILRHRSFAFQEYSQRYADPTKDLSFVLREARFQDTKNRQNSIELTPEQKYLEVEWERRQEALIGLASETYGWAVSVGIAKEQARVVLPEGLTVSRMMMAGSIRSWVHYINVRTHESTQKEHRAVALEVAKAITNIFPLTETFVHD